MVIFRENTEDIYAGIEYAKGSEEVKKVNCISYKMKWVLKKFVSLKLLVLVLNQFLKKVQSVLVRAAIKYAIKEGRKSVTLSSQR